MPSTSGTVMLRAAAHLNDINQLVYDTTVLLPMFNMALDELEEELSIYDLTPLRKQAIMILVPATSIVLPQLPPDFVEAITVRERNGGSQDDWTEVRESVTIDVNLINRPVTSIQQWTARPTNILINPPSSGREVMLDYVAGLTTAVDGTSGIDIETSRRFLALLTARNAARDLGNSKAKADTFEGDITRSRDRLTRRLQKQTQSTMGVRRLPYRGRR